MGGETAGTIPKFEVGHKVYHISLKYPLYPRHIDGAIADTLRPPLANGKFLV
jgi:hypothetical protein